MNDLIIRKFEGPDQDGVGVLYASGMNGYSHIPFVGPAYAWYIKKRLLPEGDMSNVDAVYMSSTDVVAKSCFWVAEYRNEIVGCVGAVPSTSKTYADDYVELVRMIVSESCRKKNVGRQLVDALEKWAVEVGYRNVYLLTFSALAGPNILYKKCGYELAVEEEFDVSDKLELQGPINIMVAHYIKQLA